MLDGKNLVARFDGHLADFAVKNGASFGRAHEQNPDPDRLPFQRDRDRILHAKSFRRLGGKTQVSSPKNSGDHVRNRLSHTLEVAQIARDLARELRLNEDLAESLALAHDLGHPPFAHTGEKVLDTKMRALGRKFEHNAQSLRVVQFLERRYSDFPGLNLSFEIIWGLQKHACKIEIPDFGSVASPSLEAQIVDLADEMAYLSADLEDGLRGKFFSISDLRGIEIPSRALENLPKNAEIDQIESAVIHVLFQQIVGHSRQNIQKFSVQSLADVWRCPARIVAFEPEFFAAFCALKKFLFDHYYLSESIVAESEKSREIIGGVFDFLVENPQNIPENFGVKTADSVQRAADFVAGMTDKFCTDFFHSIVKK